MTETTSQATAARPARGHHPPHVRPDGRDGHRRDPCPTPSTAAWAARELTLLTAVNYARPRRQAHRARPSVHEGHRRRRAHGPHAERADAREAVGRAHVAGRPRHREPRMHYPWLFAPGLADVSDLANDLAAKHGEWYPFAKSTRTSRAGGSRSPISICRSPAATASISSRKSARKPRHLEDLLRAGRTLKKLGHRSASPSARRRTPSPRCRRSSGASGPRMWPPTAARWPSARKRPRRPSTTFARSTPTRWTRWCSRGTTPRTTSG